MTPHAPLMTPGQPEILGLFNDVLSSWRPCAPTTQRPRSVGMTHADKGPCPLYSVGDCYLKQVCSRHKVGIVYEKTSPPLTCH